MPTKPTKTIAYQSSVDVQNILNAIRTEASLSYQERVPAATQENIRDIGSAMLNYAPAKNEFLDALINRIGLVIISNRLYENPLRRFKRGFLEYGESVEEIFVNIAKAHSFDQETSETEVFKREIPDVAAAFHKINRREFYKQTISDIDLRQAFLSYQGVSDLISKVIEGMYTANNFDEFTIMKELIVEWANEGKFYAVNVPEPTKANASDIVTTIKGYSNSLEFMSTKYNSMHVPTYSDKSKQILIMDAQFNATVDVNVLASAFNMEKAEFMGSVVMIDNFGELTGAVAALVDESFFMVFDNYYNMDSIRNPQGQYWNYFLHVWQIMSVSPYASAILFTTDEVSVDSVAVTPKTATVTKGQSLQLTATVEATGGADKTVAWSVSGAKSPTDGTQISSSGLLTVAEDETATSLVVTATSVYTAGKNDTATITVQA